MPPELLQALTQLGQCYHLPTDWLQQRPHLFASATITLSTAHAQYIAEAVNAIERVIALPAYQQHILSVAPAIAQHNPGNPGALFGYDFHLTPHGPRLIEINTNAGGAFLAALLEAATKSPLTNPPHPPLKKGGEREGNIVELVQRETQFMQMFLAEWRSVHASRPLQRIAIVDDAPEQQYLYPEFLLFQQLFKRHGIDAIIAAPEQFSIRQQQLFVNDAVIDLVYNRLTDFYFAAPDYAALRTAWQHNLAVITPHPHAHALYANKRNLVILSNADLLRTWQVDAATIALLQQVIPTTFVVDPTQADALWQQRKHLFFKPLSGYGSKGVYRGDKMTHRVFEEILTENYIAQAWTPPSELTLAGKILKVDLRAYVYSSDVGAVREPPLRTFNQVQGFIARLYQGQTTNFRTPNGGFATVEKEKD